MLSSRAPWFARTLFVGDTVDHLDYGGDVMVRKEMRDDIGKILSDKVGQLQSQLAALGDGGWVNSGKKAVGHPNGSALKGKKVAPKYRNPKKRSETWAGRGAMPKWMVAAVKAVRNARAS